MFARLIITAVISLITLSAVAQKKGADYFIHKVRGGETYKSIATQYNLTGRELADYNNLEYYTGELTAKTLRIPRKSTKKQDTAKSIKDYAIDNTAEQTPPVTADASQNTSVNPQYSAPSDTTIKEEPKDVVIETSLVRKNLPVLLYITASIILLVVAIVYYRFVNRN